MFGYVVPNKAELKIKEFDIYRAHYCGVCAALREFSGYKGALSLTYDMAFLSLLLSAVYEKGEREEKARCICHIKPHNEKRSFYSDYIAHMSVLLSYYKCIDDLHDDKNFIKGSYAALLSRKVKKVFQMYPEKASEIKKELRNVALFEKTSLDEAASAFGTILGHVFTPEDDIFKNTLFETGFYLGKFIYILDAYLDIEEDIKKGRANPLVPLCEKPGFEEECEELLNIMAAQCAARFEKLPITENAEIMRNILYGGIWQKYEEARGLKGAAQ